jgi:PKD repeat protein
MKRNQLFKLLLLSIAIMWCIPSFAQIKRGGTPPSFAAANRTKQAMQEIKLLQAPELTSLKAEDETRAKAGLMPRIATILPVNYTVENAGEWITLPTGEKIWQLRLQSPGAIALSLYYDRFYLPEGSKLFIYSANKKHVVGAFTAADNPQFGPEFSTEMIAGDELVLEYVAPATAAGRQVASPPPLFLKSGAAKALSNGGTQPVISISGIGYVYNSAVIGVAPAFYEPTGPGNEGRSAACMVNINCPEGGAWQDQKKGVAATVQRIAGAEWLCSGTILNNTAKDRTPYFLMAYHCSEANGVVATAADLNQWRFYFHFERTDCDNSSPVASYLTATGAQRLVATHINGGSDGLLLRLNTNIPDNWDIYFNGWNRTNTPMNSGVGIHHPRGDVKKISFITAPSIDDTWISVEGIGAPEAHWHIKWGTVNGKKGITEGGSSGSPLFDENGLVVGSLSGGNGNAADPCLTSTYSLYGKLWWHWDQSPDPNQHMAKYLDPLGSGVMTLDGMYSPQETAVNFVAGDTSIYVTQSIEYKDISTLAATWKWTFEGGTPAIHIGRTPPAIQYNTVGVFTTTLTINEGSATEKTATKTVTVSVKDKLVEEITGTGATTNYYAPLGTLADDYRYHRTAMLYHKEELDWMDGSGAISSLAWQKKADDPHARNIKIWMKHYPATATDLSDANSVAAISGLFADAKLVMDTAGFKNTTGYYEFPFNRGDKQFSYDPNYSLLILVETDYGDDSPTVNSVTPARIMPHHTKAYVEKKDGTKTEATVSSRPIVRMTYKITPVAPVADFTLSDATGIFSEKFDANQFPAGWTVEKPGASDNKWILDSFYAPYDFAVIDPDDVNSAVISMDSDAMVDARLISPVISIPATAVPKLSFYALWGGSDAPAGMLKFHISEDNGKNWIEKWVNAYENTVEWRKVILDIREYAGKNIQLAWRYTGQDLDAAGIDNVFISGQQDTEITIYEGEAVSFTDRSVGPPISWLWTLPGATPATSTATNLTVTYTAAGTYKASLTVANNLGTHTKTTPGAVIVKKLPLEIRWKSGSKGYTTYPHSGQLLPVSGGAVQFADASPIKPDVLEWTFSGATPTTVTEAKAEILYPSGESTYGVKLKIANDVEEKEQEIPDYVKVGGTSDIWNVAGDEDPSIAPRAYGSFLTGADYFFPKVSERFNAPAPGVVSKVQVYTTGVKQNPADSMTVAIYSDNKGLPDTLLSPVISVRGGSIINDGYNTITFPTPVSVPEAFHVVVGSTNRLSTFFGIPAVKNREENQYNTVKVFDDIWYDLAEYMQAYFFGVKLYVSMNIVPEFTFTVFELTTKDTVKKKNADPAEEHITFKTDASAWTATADSWIKLSETGGTATDVTLKFTVAENKAPEVREGVITITAGGARALITVLQGGGAPRNLNAVYNDENKSVKLAWKDAVEPFYGIFDDIENHTPMTINSSGTAGWSYIDGDGEIARVYFPNNGWIREKMAFIAMEYDPATGYVHSGTKVLFSPRLTTSSAKNDWLVSPPLDFAASYSVPSFTFSFWARSMDNDRPERIRVAYSTTGNAESDFTHVITAAPVEVPGEWTKYSYTIPAEARYVAINTAPIMTFTELLVDDIAIGIGPEPVLESATLRTNAGTTAQPVSATPEKVAAKQSAKAPVKWERTAAKNRLASPLKGSLHPQSLAPGDELVIRWDDGVFNDAIGTASGGNIEVAAKFEPADLKDYKNASIKAVEIAIKNIGANMSLKIWQGETVVHTQPITVNLPAENFNTIELTQPVPIDITKDLLVGYSFTQAPGGGNFVPGCDAGPAVAGKGDLIAMDGGPFESLLNASGGSLNVNWNISVTLVGGVSSIAYNIYRDGDLIAENVKNREYEDTKPPQADTVYYEVTAVYDEDPFFESTRSNSFGVYSKGYITVGVRDTTKVEANENPPFTSFIKDGLQPGNDADDILKSVKFTTLATSLSPAGTYQVVPLFDDLASRTYTDRYVFVAAPGVLTVTVFPTKITQQPAGTVVCTGGNHTFEVAATGLNVKYQWQHQVNGAWTNIGSEIITSGTATSSSHEVREITVADAGNYRVLVNGRSDKQLSDETALRVGLPDAELIVYPWNDVPAVNNNPLYNGGYSFVEFLWFRDGTAINGGNKPYLYVSEGTGATYAVHLTTDKGLPLAVCPFTPQVSVASSLVVYPNPITQGASLTLQSADLPEGSVANIYSSTGTLVKGNLSLSGVQNTIDIGGLTHGLYVLQVSQPDGSKQTINIVVN